MTDRGERSNEDHRRSASSTVRQKIKSSKLLRQTVVFNADTRTSRFVRANHGSPRALLAKSTESRKRELDFDAESTLGLASRVNNSYACERSRKVERSFRANINTANGAALPRPPPLLRGLCKVPAILMANNLKVSNETASDNGNGARRPKMNIYSP